MAHPTAAKLIAQRLADGLIHPGDPDRNQPPLKLPLPGFRTTGMPPQLTQTINTTTHSSPKPSCI